MTLTMLLHVSLITIAGAFSEGQLTSLSQPKNDDDDVFKGQ